MSFTTLYFFFPTYFVQTAAPAATNIGRLTGLENQVWVNTVIV